MGYYLWLSRSLGTRAGRCNFSLPTLAAAAPLPSKVLRPAGADREPSPPQDNPQPPSPQAALPGASAATRTGCQTA
jgi:hypothetical protein